MQTLARAMVANPDVGEPLPSPFSTFASYKLFHRRGQVSLVASASGGGKSAYATHVAVHTSPKIPTVYCSADTDPHTLGVRVASSIINEPTTRTEQLLRNRSDPLWAKVNERTSHVWWHWNTSPSCEDVKDEVEAYAIENGHWPHLIVVDNLINVDGEGESGHQQKDGVMLWLAQLAKYTNAHVMVLHHVTKEYVNGNIPIPKAGLLDSVDKRPRLVLTMHRLDEMRIGVRIVKNSGGPADAMANFGPDLAVMFDLSWMEAIAA